MNKPNGMKNAGSLLTLADTLTGLGNTLALVNVVADDNIPRVHKVMLKLNDAIHLLRNMSYLEEFEA